MRRASDSSPASAPASVPGPAASNPNRRFVHHSYIWLGSLRIGVPALVAIVVALLPQVPQLMLAFDITLGDGLPALATVLGGLALVVLAVGIALIYQAVSYRHLWFELGESEFSLYSGILSKKHVHVPYGRIQSVDQRASLLQRVFGVCTVSIDTAGGAANKAVTVPYLQQGEAERLRAELFARKRIVLHPQTAAVVAEGFGADGSAGAGPENILDAPAELWNDLRGVFAGDAIDTGRVSYEYGMTNKELLLTGLSNNTAFALVLIGLIGGAAQAASLAFDVAGDGAAGLVDQALQAGASVFGGMLAVAAAVVFVVVVLVLWALSGLRSCLYYGGFHARRRDNRIEVEHGLLQHRFQGVAIDRVQSVVVKQSFIRRLMGYCELSLGKVDAVDASSSTSSQQQSGLNPSGLVIHPFVKLSRVPEILAGLAPEFADLPVNTQPVARVAFRRALVRRCIIQGPGFWIAVCLAVSHLLVRTFFVPATPEDELFLLWFDRGMVAGYVACALITAVSAVSAVLWARESSFAYNRSFLQVKNGGLACETVSLPRQKIQCARVRTNPFQRRAHTATISVRTAAGYQGTTVRLIDVCEEAATAWRAWAKPGGNVVQ